MNRSFRIHPKVYIMRKNPVYVPDQFGSVITGSSNFSLAGLQNNLEFNVELKDSYDVKFALDKFESLWNQGVDITDTYVATVNNRTWLRNDITPYEIFLKTIYEFFKEEINADKEELAENLLPDGYMRLQYQIDAVRILIKINTDDFILHGCKKFFYRTGDNNLSSINDRHIPAEFFGLFKIVCCEDDRRSSFVEFSEKILIS